MSDFVCTLNFCTKTACQWAVSRSAHRWTPALLAALLAGGMTGCSSVEMPSLSGLDLMSTTPTLFPGSQKNSSPYQMLDGTPPPNALSADGSMTMEGYQKIREAKAQNAVVLQVAGDEQPVRILPLPAGEKSVFVSELLAQTGVLRKFGAVHAAVYRPSPESISGIKMDVKFSKNGTIDPATDYGLRPGDRVQVRKKHNTGLQSLVNLAMQR